MPESLLGQASVHDSITRSNCDSDWDSLGAEIERLCPNEDPSDIIMKVKVEEDKSDMFMEGSPLIFQEP